MKIILHTVIALSVLAGAYLFGDAITAELATCMTEGQDCPWRQDYARCQRAGTTDLNGGAILCGLCRETSEVPVTAVGRDHAVRR